MIAIVLALTLISLAALERIIYVKSNKNYMKIRLVIKVLILILLITLCYYITDNSTDTFYVLLSWFAFFLLQRSITKSYEKCYIYLMIIVQAFVTIYIIINVTKHMLVYSGYIFCLLIILFSILGYSPKNQIDIKESFKITLILLVALTLVFYYYKLLGREVKIMTKPEMIAEEFIEKKLKLSDFNIYLDIFERGLREDEIFVKAYQGQEKLIIMVYKDGKIIRHEIKNLLK